MGVVQERELPEDVPGHAGLEDRALPDRLLVADQLPARINPRVSHSSDLERGTGVCVLS